MLEGITDGNLGGNILWGGVLSMGYLGLLVLILGSYGVWREQLMGLSMYSIGLRIGKS
ncbi:hypothetical protein GTQ34_14540 [Muricauda sp. JGD-17]|uniref:Uncharacterized protein n=1 Tax=Flagellimonas ochracea TaxID=2696472 RepID=A0A964WYE2_9FLAO|nr:hypothetical protein [Allomuricauda ochracea]NAY93131.1 hypothetical protein [Allomuricauda ochracea]